MRVDLLSFFSSFSMQTIQIIIRINPCRSSSGWPFDLILPKFGVITSWTSVGYRQEIAKRWSAYKTTDVPSPNLVHPAPERPNPAQAQSVSKSSRPSQSAHQEAS